MSGGMAWTIRGDSLELWRGLVVHGMGEIDFHVFWKYWKLSSSTNTSKLVIGGLQVGPRIFLKARAPSQELYNQLVFQKMTTTNKYFPGTWTTSQNRHFQ